MNKRSDIMRMTAMCISVAFMVASAVFASFGDMAFADVCVGDACVFLLWAVIIKMELL